MSFFLSTSKLSVLIYYLQVSTKKKKERKPNVTKQTCSRNHKPKHKNTLKETKAKENINVQMVNIRTFPSYYDKFQPGQLQLGQSWKRDR